MYVCDKECGHKGEWTSWLGKSDEFLLKLGVIVDKPNVEWSFQKSPEAANN